MFLPYTVDVPMTRLPLANWALILVTVVLTIYGWTQDYQLAQGRTAQGPPPLRTWALARDHTRPAQFFTYVFAHGDIEHLVGNMLFLFVFGNAVNAKLGHALFLVLYFVLGAFAGLCWLLAGTGSALVGASGAIMGLCGLFLVFYPANDVCVLFLYYGLHWFEIRALWVVLLAMASDLLGTVFFGGGSGIAYVCHLGGELLGVALGVGLLFSGFVKSERYELNLLQVAGFQPRPGEKKRKRKRMV